MSNLTAFICSSFICDFCRLLNIIFPIFHTIMGIMKITKYALRIIDFNILSISELTSWGHIQPTGLNI